ncbi:MAG TPA: PIN domain-containing protein [archaeon]|nr:PIN domain-containing protein [archaeon]HLD81267.1 PIN domain-containing protein [archaeon]
MILVIDTNRIIAALIRDSYSRKLLLDDRLSFYTPFIARAELEEHKPLLLKRTGLTSTEFDALLERVLQRTSVMHELLLAEKYPIARRVMAKIDIDDAQFVAAALTLDCPIWSDDKHFQRQKAVKVFTTKDLLELYNGR